MLIIMIKNLLSIKKAWYAAYILHPIRCSKGKAKATPYILLHARGCDSHRDTATVSLRCVSGASNHRKHFRLVNLYSVGAEEGFGFGEEFVRYGREVLAGGFYIGIAVSGG